MNGTHLDETRLHDAADGTLSGADARAVDAHLAACAACAERVRAIRDLLDEARGLAVPVEPARDLWPGIRDRMAGRENEVAFPAPARADEAAPRVRRAWPPALRIAASVALLVTGAAAGVLIARTGQTSGAPEAAAGSPPSDVTLVADPTDLRATVANEYENPVAGLQAELDRRRDELPPETVAEIERNLEIVDRAIEAAMAAFDEAPDNPVLPQMLQNAYGRKVELLEQAVRLPRTI
ncbi:MAG TPA: zf-HC2 domain-containing protein [Longimicrobiales bacterium]|nr:zf-HC2 domain-containing protein [Longimicrobiales bacterium]